MEKKFKCKDEKITVMKQEDKELLLKDLSARLPYKVQMHCFDLEVGDDDSYTGNKIGSDQTLFGINLLNIETEYAEESPIICVDAEGQEGCYSLDEIKPYLRSLSSMTEEEMDSYNNEWENDRKTITTIGKGLSEAYKDKIKNSIWQHPVVPFQRHIDYLNKNKFDYYGLIPKGLALEAPEGMYK